jgi:hypothetical protein
MPRLPMPSDTEALAEKTCAAVRHILPHGGHGGAVERRHTIWLSVGDRHRLMRPEEGVYVAHCQGNLLLVLLPRVEAHLGVRRETHALHGHGVWVRRHVVRQDQYRRLAVAYEIARHGEDEVWIRAVHLFQKGVDHRHRDVGTAGAQPWGPGFDVVVIEEVGHLWTEPAGLRQHSRDDALGRSLQQVPDEGAADAEAQHHELRRCPGDP